MEMLGASSHIYIFHKYGKLISQSDHLYTLQPLVCGDFPRLPTSDLIQFKFIFNLMGDLF